MSTDTCLSIIIVNWNSTDFARECIRSVYEHTSGVSFEIIVVDNASPANDVDLLQQSFPFLTIIKSKENLGFARANNLGVTKAKGECLLFLNPDTKLIQPAFELMIDALRSRPDAGGVCCKLLNEDLSVQTTCIQTFPTILNQALDADALRKRWPDSSLWGVAPLASACPEPVPVEVISGACLLTRRDVFVKVGMFSEDYFMYAEDLDLCRKLVLAGYRNYYTGATQLIHFGGGSSTPDTATIMKWRSIVRYCEKHRGKSYTFLFRVVMVVVAMGRLSILTVMKRSTPGAPSGYSPMDKWKAILSTLLTSAGGHQHCGAE
jgi:GT2 family glycosyltransferase